MHVNTQSQLREKEKNTKWLVHSTSTIVLLSFQLMFLMMINHIPTNGDICVFCHKVTVESFQAPIG